jgi:hypothetical protein
MMLMRVTKESGKTLLERLPQSTHFMVDGEGNKKAVLLDIELWEELLRLLEDLEDAEEILRARAEQEEAIPWEQAKAELRAEGVDV